MLDLCWIFKTHDSLCKKIVGVLCFIQWLETWTWVNCPGYGCWLNCPEISIFMHFHHPCLPDIASFEMFLHDSFQGFETKVFFKLRNPPKININMYHDLPPTVAMFGMKSSGWWFGTWILWLSIYWESHHPNRRTHIFPRGRSTTNQSSNSIVAGRPASHLHRPSEHDRDRGSKEIHGFPVGGFLSHGGTPSHHPFLPGIFHYKPQGGAP